MGAYMFEHRHDPKNKPLFELAFGKRPAEELDDLKKDPDPLSNVAGDPSSAETKQRPADRLIDELTASAAVSAVSPLVIPYPHVSMASLSRASWGLALPRYRISSVRSRFPTAVDLPESLR